MIRGILGYIWQKITYVPDWSLKADLQNYAITSCYNRASKLYETYTYRMDRYRKPIGNYRIRQISIDEDHAKLMHYRAVDIAIKMEMGIRRPEESYWEIC